MDVYEAHAAVMALRVTLDAGAKRDPEQEVQGIALPVLDSVLAAGRGFLPDDHPVVATIYGVFTPETIAAGDPIRAYDALLVVRQLESALARLVGDAGPRQRTMARPIPI